MVSNLFDDFKKNLLNKGVNLEEKIGTESSKILESLLDDTAKGFTVHSDHSSFTRHSSCAADEEQGNTCKDQENTGNVPSSKNS
jgi:hypothetical protein